MTTDLQRFRQTAKGPEASDGEEHLAGQLRAARLAGLNIGDPIRQYRFCDRKWAFDFAWPGLKVAVEVDGGTWSGGRHSRGQGYAADCIKLNEAICLGWRVLRVTTDQAKSGQALGLDRAGASRMKGRKRMAAKRRSSGFRPVHVAPPEFTPKEL